MTREKCRVSQDELEYDHGQQKPEPLDEWDRADFESESREEED